MLLIREMEIIDIESIYEIEKEAFADPWSKSALIDELNNENALYYVALLDNEVKAYIGMWKIFDEGHITNIAVKKENRRFKIGQQLLEKLIEKGNELGIRSYTLEVRESNISALNMYLKAGFNIAGKRKNFYSNPLEDAIIMWLDF